MRYMAGVAEDGVTVVALLVHGFGVSISHWREEDTNYTLCVAPCAMKSMAPPCTYASSIVIVGLRHLRKPGSPRGDPSPCMPRYGGLEPPVTTSCMLLSYALQGHLLPVHPCVSGVICVRG